ncbi:uncharacterized protein LOC132558769 [Ylistrum balloti]|uniref:uncharacterized protein LOC132558769 n=1 Tax=Ylistrum balloti TaxID=509963 RepID=UPI002905E2BA|nr:uncharacterized protein LOC132558769 [Ylistrum balloti]
MEYSLAFGVILTNIIEIVCASNGKFIKINGYKLSGAFSIWNFYFNGTRLKCAETCLQTTCLSFNYHSQTEECQLNTESHYTNPLIVQEAQDWALYYLHKENDWELVFRAQAYNNISPYNAWMGTLSLPTLVEEGCLLLMNTSTCTTIYRNDILNTWDSESISEVKLELYQAGVTVVNIRFNGTGSNYTDWFSIDRLIDSSWDAMSKSRDFNHFTLLATEKRRFFINQNYGGCPNDVGWMAVIDAGSNIAGCAWDSMLIRPAFLFAKGEDATRWMQFDHGFADVLAVFIKR